MAACFTGILVTKQLEEVTWKPCSGCEPMDTTAAASLVPKQLETVIWKFCSGQEPMNATGIEQCVCKEHLEVGTRKLLIGSETTSLLQ